MLGPFTTSKTGVQQFGGSSGIYIQKINSTFYPEITSVSMDQSQDRNVTCIAAVEVGGVNPKGVKGCRYGNRRCRDRRCDWRANVAEGEVVGFLKVLRLRIYSYFGCCWLDCLVVWKMSTFVLKAAWRRSHLLETLGKSDHRAPTDLLMLTC